MYFVYILKCNDNSFYTGFTPDLERRLSEHTSKHGASYTRTRMPVVLVYKEVFDSEFKARQREKQIKGWSRKKKQALTNGDIEMLIAFSKAT